MLPRLRNVHAKALKDIENMETLVSDQMDILRNALTKILAAYGEKYNVPHTLSVGHRIGYGVLRTGDIGVDIDFENKQVRFNSPIPFVTYLTFDELSDVNATIAKINSGTDRYAKLFFDHQNQNSIKRFMKYKELEKEFGPKSTAGICCGTNGCTAG